MYALKLAGPMLFLSTLSLRRATKLTMIFGKKGSDFYPRSPCGERQKGFWKVYHSYKFLSTLSLRRATSSAPGAGAAAPISIHALLAESDMLSLAVFTRAIISIHALLAESDNYGMLQRCPLKRFLSTLSLRRATVTAHTWQGGTTDFYPRSPCGERQQKCGDGEPHINFYPRSPCGERLTVPDLGQRNIRISIHALLAESDFNC